MPQSAAQRVATAAKRAKCVELAAKGMSYDEIAQAVGYSNRGAAHKAITAALNAHQAEGVQMLRQLECDRLDSLQRALWADVLAGDVKAVDSVLQIVQARMRLLGLDRPEVLSPRGRDRVLVDPAELPQHLAESRA